MANDKEWEKHTNEWIEMSNRSRLRKEASGKSLQRTETNLTELEHQCLQPVKKGPHGHALPPRHR
jgi:hypothetical protein